MQDVYKNIEEYNLGKKCNVLIVKMITNKKLNPVVTKFFIRGRILKSHILKIKIIKSYFKVPKEVRLYITHFFIMKIPNKREFKQIVLNHSLVIVFKDFIKIFKKYTAKPLSFLVNDTTLPLDNPLGFRKHLLK